MYNVITIGSATRDVFLTSRDFKIIKSKKFPTGQGECFSLGGKIEIADMIFDTGGGATNAAATFANLGLKTAAVVRVGDDLGGQEIIRNLKNLGIAASFVKKIKEERTGYSVILLTKGGERTVLVYRGASAHFTARDIPLAKLKTSWFYITSLGGNLTLLKKIFSFAYQKEIGIFFNPGSKELKQGLIKLTPLLKKVCILDLNREEAAQVTGFPSKDIKKIINKLAKTTPAWILITDGPRGAYLWDGVEILFAKPTGIRGINKTGAGDAFGSGFLAGLIKKNDAKFALRLGICNAEGVIQEMGAKIGLLKRIPSLRDLNTVKIRKVN